MQSRDEIKTTIVKCGRNKNNNVHCIKIGIDSVEEVKLFFYSRRKIIIDRGKKDQMQKSSNKQRFFQEE